MRFFWLTARPNEIAFPRGDEDNGGVGKQGACARFDPAGSDVPCRNG